MKIKILLRFYFAAERIDKHLDGLILKYACNPLCQAEQCAEKICELICEKQALSALWVYLDGIARGLSRSELKAVEKYSAMRTGLKKLESGEIKALRRSVIKFVRHARRIEAFKEEVNILKKYYCLTCRDGNSGSACP